MTAQRQETLPKGRQALRERRASTPRTLLLAGRRTRRTALQLGALVVFLALWEAFARLIGAIDIPGSIDTLTSLVDLIGSADLWRAVWVSNLALFAGYVLAAVAGVVGGLLIGRSRNADAVFRIWLSILMITPMAMMIPIIIMALGFGFAPRMVVVFVFVLPMVVVNVKAGVRTISPDLLDMSRAFGASEAQIWRKIILPGASPAIFTGLRIGMGRAVTGMVISEWLLAAVGVGSLLLKFRGSFQSDHLYALVLVILAESLLLIALLRLAERKLIGWSRRSLDTDAR